MAAVGLVLVSALHWSWALGECWLMERAVDRMSSSSIDGEGGQLRLPASVLAAGTALLGLVASVWMIRTGHEGTRIVWDGVLPTE